MIQNPLIGRLSVIVARVMILSTILSSYAINASFVFPTLKYLHDFGSFVASGQLANDGQNPYSDKSPLVLTVSFPFMKHEGTAPNLNPPISILIFQHIANYDLLLSSTIWRIASILFFLAAIFLLHRSYPEKGPRSPLRSAWTLSLAGLWHTVQLGQIYTLVFLIAVMAWLLIRQKRSILGGLFLGLLIAIKPNFAFWPLLLWISGDRSAFLTAGIVATSISAVPMAFHGYIIYSQWLEAISIFTPDLLLFAGNVSLQSLAVRFGFAQAGLYLSIILAIFILIYVSRKKPSTSSINSLGIITSLLISPIAWTGYTLLTLPILFEKKYWNWMLWVAAFTFTVPFYVTLSLFQNSFTHSIIFGWFYGWGLLLILGETILVERLDSLESKQIVSRPH